MSNYDGGWLFKCCPSETPCPCSWEDAASPFCADHCDRTLHCEGSKVDEVKHAPVNKDHLQAWYDWAGRILDADTDHNEADAWQLNCACARLRVAISDLLRLKEKHNEI
jgi:hypothetical protein